MRAVLILFLCPSFLWFACLAVAAEMSLQQRRGQQIYIQGTNTQGGEILARLSSAGTHLSVSAALMPCVNCHGRDGRGKVEGGIVTSDIRWSVLTRPYNARLANGRQHSIYDEKALKKAIGMGLAPNGTEIKPIMPRYQLTQQDMADLIAYLKGLGEYSVTGISGSSIRIGVILPRANPGKINAIQQSLRAFFSQLNANGGIYQRKIKLYFTVAPSTGLDNWDTFSAQLKEAELFALVASELEGIESPISAFSKKNGLPIVGGFSRYPILKFPLNRYIFYFFSGYKTQNQALASFARQQYSINTANIRIISTSENRFKQAAIELAKDWRNFDQIEPDIIIVPPDGEKIPPGKTSASAVVKTLESLVTQLRNDNVELIYMLGAVQSQEDFLSAAAAQGWWPTVMIPGAHMSSRLLNADLGFDKRILVAMPALPRDYRAEAIISYKNLSAQYQLPKTYKNSQLYAIAAATLLVEGLTRSGRELDQEKLIDSLEHFYRYDTLLSNPITYGPNRRLGVSGSYIVSIDLVNKTITPRSEWIEID